MMRLSPEEIGLWRRVMRDVIPLRGRPEYPLPEPPPPAGKGRVGVNADETQAVLPAPVGAASSQPPPPPPARLPPLDRFSGHFAGLDRASAERLRRGRYPIEARLDLHGMTQAEAHRALTGFVAGSRAIGRRVVLVITGHGRVSGGILKAAAPRWLNEPELRRHVLAITPARPRDGGAGALYLLLRKAS
jgi:DNA-nicking Smr family endonuclease